MCQVLQVLQMCLTLEQGHVDAVQGRIRQAAVCGQFLGVQFSESQATRLDLLAEEASTPRQQAQLQPIAASAAGTQRCQCGDEADKRQGCGQDPQCQRVTFLQDRVV